MTPLWLCIHLPQLPLDALQAAPPEQPVAVLDAARHVLTVNPAARARGVVPGLLASSARALAPALHGLPRQPEAERRALDGLAAWSLRYTSWVSPAPPRDLLLEIGGSLTLFGPPAELRARIARGLHKLDYTARLGIAPTPSGARVLARSDATAISLAELRQALDPLPLEMLDWDAALCRRIRGVGARTIGEALVLPRGGFNQRYGRAQGRQLEQLLGRAADPRPAFVPPRRYRRRLEPASETRDSQALLPGFRRLFLDLAATLEGCDSGVTQLDIRLHHARHPATALQLGLRAPGRDAGHWQRLLEEHFQRLALPDEVRGIELAADAFVSLGRSQAQFWPQPGAGEEQALLERLAARLGPSKLFGLASCQTHAPEQAWRHTEAGRGEDAASDGRPRPLWLLPEPEAVDPARLQLLSQAERLETRWWGQDCRRDYYRARDARGRRLWVFREHAPPRRWFIHGLFG